MKIKLTRTKKKVKRSKKKAPLISALEITDRYVKLLQARGAKGAIDITTVAIRPLASNSDNDVTTVLNQLCDEFDVRKSSVYFHIPRKALTMRYLSIPSTDPDEIGKMVSLQAAKQLPYPAEEIIYDHVKVKDEPNGYAKVLLAIAHRDVVKRSLDLLGSAGIDPRMVALDAESLALWYTRRKGPKAPAATEALIELDADSAEIEIIESGHLVLSRSASLAPEEGGQIDTGKRSESSLNLERLIRELEKTLLISKKENIKEIERIVLTGAGDYFAKAKDALGSHFHLPVEELDSIEEFAVSPDLLFSPGRESMKKVSFGSLLGLIKYSESLQIDLIPPEVREVRATLVARREVVRVAAFFVSAVMIFAASAWLNMSNKERCLLRLDAELKRNEGVVNRVSKMVRNIDTIKEQLSRRVSAIDVMREIYRITPQGVSLVSIDFAEGKILLLRGTSGSMSEALELLSTLEESPFFTDAKMKYATKRMVKGVELTDFELSSSLTVDADLKVGDEETDI
ncbi:MAG: pilus assembly protein PilM [Candidatus Omnitrophica bacterium]|nr:pilus assembly protein PilM [Candidatus Omnitrophota bacterium]